MNIPAHLLDEYCMKLKIPASANQDVNILIYESLRIDFAKAAMQGILASGDDLTIEAAVDQSFKVAGAMLKKLENEGSK